MSFLIGNCMQWSTIEREGHNLSKEDQFFNLKSQVRWRESRSGLLTKSTIKRWSPEIESTVSPVLSQNFQLRDTFQNSYKNETFGKFSTICLSTKLSKLKFVFDFQLVFAALLAIAYGTIITSPVGYGNLGYGSVGYNSLGLSSWGVAPSRQVLTYPSTYGLGSYGSVYGLGNRWNMGYGLGGYGYGYGRGLII